MTHWGLRSQRRCKPKRAERESFAPCVRLSSSPPSSKGRTRKDTMIEALILRNLECLTETFSLITSSNPLFLALNLI